MPPHADVLQFNRQEKQMAITPASLRAAIDNHFRGQHVHIMWLGSASECGGMRFSPLPVADYLSDLAIASVGQDRAPIGGIHHHVWQLAYAETREHAGLAMRNLASLLDGVIDLPDDEDEP